MTPIKVGEYTVRRCAIEYVNGCEKSWIVEKPKREGPGHSEHYRTLPMALRVAAEAAGIERQRVEVYRYPPFIGGYGTALITYSVNGLDYFETFDRDDVDDRNECGDMAHRFARERYAALGGAA